MLLKPLPAIDPLLPLPRIRPQQRCDLRGHVHPEYSHAVLFDIKRDVQPALIELAEDVHPAEDLVY